MVQFRSAGPGDAERVALLHADSWRRHYRGAFADSFLDGDIETERRAVWSSRLAAPEVPRPSLPRRVSSWSGSSTWSSTRIRSGASLVDNLHVRHDQRRTGVGRQLLARAGQAVADQANSDAIYLWVLQQNTAAQQFYLAVGATCVETAPVSPPGGDPARLNGAPDSLRMVWSDAGQLAAT